MNTAAHLRLLGLLLGLLGASPAQAQSMRCDGDLVTPGDTSLTLTQRCGEPDLVTTRLVAETTRAVGTALTGATTEVIEEVETWLYQRESGELARLVTVRRGEVQAIRQVNIPTVDDPEACARTTRPRQSERSVVRVACGAPLDVSRWSERRTVVVAGIERRALVTHERWVYDLGPGRFLLVLTFEDDVLVDLERGRRRR